MDLYELFPEKKNLKLRKDIIEIIHPKVKQHGERERVAEQRHDSVN